MTTQDYVRENFLIVLSGPSGAGKSSILQRVLETRKDISYSISYTTRKPRGEEKHGRDYFFVDRSTFEDMIEKDRFLEYAKVHDHYYGTSAGTIKKIMDAGRHAIMDIDVQGAESVMEGCFRTVSVFILPPDVSELTRRLKDRRTDSEAQIRLRLQNARKEIGQLNLFDYLLINDNLDQSVNEILAIITAEENRLTSYIDPESIFYTGENE